MDDLTFLKELYSGPHVGKYLKDDNSIIMGEEQFKVIINTDVIYPLISSEDGKNTGLFLFFPWNVTTYELHVAVMLNCRGRHSVIAGTMAGKWMFEHTPCRKIITMIPKPNYPAKWLALAVGMKQEGINRKSYLRDGVLHDQYLFGICKEDVY